MWQIWISVHPVTKLSSKWSTLIEGILPKWPYPPCLRMADRALLAGYPRYKNYSSPNMTETVSTIHTSPLLFFLPPAIPNTPAIMNCKKCKSWWRHHMETFSALLAMCAGKSPVPGEFLIHRPVTQSFDAFFDLRRINGWVNDREADDLRRHRTHYDVIVMWYQVRYHSLIITRSNFSKILAISNIFFIKSCHFGEASMY